MIDQVFEVRPGLNLARPRFVRDGPHDHGWTIFVPVNQFGHLSFVRREKSIGEEVYGDGRTFVDDDYSIRVSEVHDFLGVRVVGCPVGK